MLRTRTTAHDGYLRAALRLAIVVILSGCGAGSTIGAGSRAIGGIVPSAGATSTATPASSPTNPSSAAPTAAPTPGAGGTATVGSPVGPSPGPAILYAAAATPPQLTNAGMWTATPILISGASAYRSGEYLYQDFLYDDHGANGTVPDANQTGEVTAGALSRFTGTYSYPTGASYGGNAADLVEFRMKPAATATAFRITLNTMIDPSVYACTIALGTSQAAIAMPHGANAKEPAQMFVTVHGTTGDIIDAASGQVVGTPTVMVDQTRRQVTVLVPYSVYDTRGNTALRVAAAVGLWNSATGAYLLPSAASSATAGGGSGSLLNPPAFYNVAFRHAEPSLGGNLTYTAQNATSYWRDYAQATALAAGDLSSFSDTVDMTKLAAGANDDMHGLPQGVSTSGHIDRILPSHFEPFQGRKFTSCSGDATYCPPEYGNALQPYAVYVPAQPPPAGGYPLTPLLHSLTVNYNQYANTNNEMQFASRDGGSIVFTTEGRGPDNWYYGLALADVFEVWADIARNYPIDENNVAMTGYSMGGYATFKLGVLYPDLFGSMQPTVGPAFVGVEGLNDGSSNDTKPMFASLRNLPILSWHASADELVQTPFALEEEQSMASDGLNFEWDLFAPAEHLTLTLNDEYAPAAAFIAKTSNNVNPPHVTYVRNPSMDAAAYQIVNDHAYWVSSIVERDTSKVTGTIDILSHGFGVGDPPLSGAQPVLGTLTGGSVAAIAYTGFKETYGTPPSEPVADALTITATIISAATVTPSRAKIDCNATLDVTTDGPLTIALAGCPNGPQSFAKGHTLTRPRVRPARTTMTPR